MQAYETNVMRYFHQDWYAQFYGTEPTEKFRVIIGCTNGSGNYGPTRQIPGQLSIRKLPAVLANILMARRNES